MSNKARDYIHVRGARVHNLKNITVKIPKNKFVVITGISGSGKSSLAFDTIFAEGQRRYVESLSSYARQFLGTMEKPDVESITGLSPAISIDQKTSGRNPRSTVGTITEINDYLRLLFARIGKPHCPKCGKPVQAQSIQQIVDDIMSKLKTKSNTKIQILSPIVKGRKGKYQDLLENLLSKGFIRVRIDGDVRHLEEEITLKKNIKHTIEIVVDRLEYSKSDPALEKDDFIKRLSDSVEIACNNSDGEVIAIINDKELLYSENNSCPKCGISFPQLEPHSFSFNSPYGACPTCSGLGVIKKIAIDLLYNPNLTITEGGIFPWSNMTTTPSWTLKKLEAVAKAHNFSLRTRIGKYSKEIFDLIFYGKGALPNYTVEYMNKYGNIHKYESSYEGVIPLMHRRYKETTSDYSRDAAERYMKEILCEDCKGKRLKSTSLSVLLHKKNISDIYELSIDLFMEWLNNLHLSGQDKLIAKPIIQELEKRTTFLQNTGLNYLTLSRRANTLSGGEAQRIRLASQIGTGLTGVLYVLDEPSIGLHARDMKRLIKTLRNLKALGNTILVVEHDKDTIQAADWLIDMGPGAGERGGKIIAQGTPKQVSRNPKSITGKYLSKKIEITHSKPSNNKALCSLKLFGASQYNLKNIDVEFPLGKLITVTGVSGSGKSTLIIDTLYKILLNELQNGKQTPGKYSHITGIENVTKIININQSPIGRTPRSNPATYTGLFTPIRDIFAQTREARARGYKAGRFSFNVKGGRCETCKGKGSIKIEMNFLPDTYITCAECKGKRYTREVLQIDFKGKNIADVLNMSVTEALDFFQNYSPIERRLNVLDSVGLGYIRLGQSATTLSGGEAQRVKLSTELSKTPRGHTIYLLDEPTTGLHFHDVSNLIKVLHKLVGLGHTVILIEHDLDIIRVSDWIIDMGPEGGDGGGEVLVAGTVKDVMKCKRSYTGKALKQ
ncbi:MAG: excinuclease ABC subunit UvrA [Patescibacteria group bacterium]|nr:excinuclease ABC subunit UvrA [Patescibacteria group bacterium]